MATEKPDERPGLLTFVESEVFRTAWKRCRLIDRDLFELQMSILADPTGGPIVRGTGGIRKVRFSPSRTLVGKSGAFRVLYCYFQEFGNVLVVTAYPKSKKDNISMAGKKIIKEMIEHQHRLLSRGRMR